MVDQKIRREVSVLFLAPASNYAAFPHNSSTKKKGKKEKKFLRTRLFSTSNFFFCFQFSFFSRRLTLFSVYGMILFLALVIISHLLERKGKYVRNNEMTGKRKLNSFRCFFSSRLCFYRTYVEKGSHCFPEMSFIPRSRNVKFRSCSSCCCSC